MKTTDGAQNGPPGVHGVEGAQAGEPITRAVAARLLGVSKTTVRNLERRGTLHPQGGDGEERTFDAQELAAVAETIRARPRARPGVARSTGRPVDGRTAARVFRSLRAGLSHEEIVIKHNLLPEIVSKLFVQWRRGFRVPGRRSPTSVAAPPSETSFPAFDSLVRGLHVHAAERVQGDEEPPASAHKGGRTR